MKSPSHDIRRRSKGAGDQAEHDPAHSRAADLLRLAQEAQLLAGTGGSLTLRSSAGGYWATPRRRDQTTLGPNDLIHIDANELRRNEGDSAVPGWLYPRLPAIEALLHFHGPLVLCDAETLSPHPGEAIEEGSEVYQRLGEAALAGDYQGGGFAVGLAGQGYWLGLEPGGVTRLRAEWDQAQEEYTSHLQDMGIDHANLRLRPLFASSRIVGVLAEPCEGPAVAAFLVSAARGQGLGERVVAELVARRNTVVAHDECQVIGYYEERGFRVIERQGPLAWLEPPSKRTDLRQAASVCLFDPVAQEVLIGRRETKPWYGYWAFPGGKVEPGESHLQAAGRELTEETGIELPHAEPAWETHVVVGTGDVAFGLVNYCVLSLDRPQPQATAEIAARWVPLERAAQLRPMAAGTRRVLRRLVAASRRGAPPR